MRYVLNPFEKEFCMKRVLCLSLLAIPAALFSMGYDPLNMESGPGGKFTSHTVGAVIDPAVRAAQNLRRDYQQFMSDAYPYVYALWNVATEGVTGDKKVQLAAWIERLREMLKTAPTPAALHTSLNRMKDEISEWIGGLATDSGVPLQKIDDVIRRIARKAPAAAAPAAAAARDPRVIMMERLVKLEADKATIEQEIARIKRTLGMA